jgi:serine/threonine protein kinase
MTQSGSDAASALPAAGEDLAAELRPELEILRALGSGSTAEVYLAREPALQRMVAVKVLRRELASDPVVRRRFEREAQSAARIVHPNITAIHRVGALSGDVPYIVMEHIDGRTVSDVLEAVGPFAIDDARRLLAAVAAALAAVHERSIIHRDVRPGNVYVENRTGRAVLGDFGIAALLDSGSAAVARLTAAGVRLGDARYRSPEQVRGETVTEQSDVYAFGILAYEVLTGSGPYPALTNAQLLAAHLQSPVRRLRDLLPTIDAATANLIENCLAKDANRRPRARELAVKLNAPAGTEAESSAEERGPLGLFLDEMRRRRVYQVLVAYGAFAAAVLGTMQAVFDAFSLTLQTYRIVVLLTLGGLPVAVALAWIYDITAGGIRRTRAAAGSSRLRWFKLLGLAASVLLAAAIGWLLLRGR